MVTLECRIAQKHVISQPSTQDMEATMNHLEDGLAEEGELISKMEREIKMGINLSSYNILARCRKRVDIWQDRILSALSHQAPLGDILTTSGYETSTNPRHPC